MKDLFAMVRDFNDAFGVKVNNSFLSEIIAKEDPLLYYNLMKEEMREYFDATMSDDDVETADALIDMMYVLVGLMLKHGMDKDLFEKCFEEVHDSNMSKLEGGKPVYREDGKVIKGRSFRPPNLKRFLRGNSITESPF